MLLQKQVTLHVCLYQYISLNSEMQRLNLCEASDDYFSSYDYFVEEVWIIK